MSAREDMPSRPVLTDVSVVIPTLGRAILNRSLDALAAGTRWPYRLVVVDQGSNHEVAVWLDRLSSAGLHSVHLRSKEKGRALGVNQGIRNVSTRFVCITDDDCLVEPDWLERMHEHLTASPDVIVTGRIDAEGEGVIVVSTSRRPTVQRRPRLRFDALSGGNMGMAVATTERIGLLDESPCLRTAEDHEYAYRALRAGVAVAYAPDAGVCHLGWRSGEERDQQFASYARSHGGFYGKYLRQGDLFIALRAVVHLARAMRKWGAARVRGDRERASMARAYAAGLLPGIVGGWRSLPDS